MNDTHELEISNYFVAYRDVGKEREHDCTDAGGRAMPGAIADGCGSFAYRDVGKEREHDCTDAGGRAMPGAIADGCGSFAKLANISDIHRVFRLVLEYFRSHFRSLSN